MVFEISIEAVPFFKQSRLTFKVIAGYLPILHPDGLRQARSNRL